MALGSGNPNTSMFEVPGLAEAVRYVEMCEFAQFGRGKVVSNKHSNSFSENLPHN
jgi:hypothetical protein